MSSRTRHTDVDDRSLLLLRNGVGVRRSTVDHLTYDLVAIADDVDSLIAAAGGWLCDRARAGWQVTVVVPDGIEVRPLQILGVRTAFASDPYQYLRGSSPASLALPSELIAGHPQIAKFVERALERRIIEVTLWGDSVPERIAHHFDKVCYAGSDAARAFKPHALAAAGSAMSEESIEEFHSVALWYPVAGTDLTPVG
jgi:hypothetical protein